MDNLDSDSSGQPRNCLYFSEIKPNFLVPTSQALTTQDSTLLHSNEVLQKSRHKLVPGISTALKDRPIFHPNSERAWAHSDSTRLMAKRTRCSHFPGCLTRKKGLTSKLVQQMEKKYSFSATASNRFEMPTSTRMPGRHQGPQTSTK